MSSGAYVALSGLQARAEQLNRLAADIANVGTAGYKAERGTTAAAERPVFESALQSAVDVASGPQAVDFRPGSITKTGGDFDLAIDGPGFFAIETPNGVRYTRNGHFTRRADSLLATSDGHPVLGDDGKPIELPEMAGPLVVGEDGLLRVGPMPIGRPRIVEFVDPSRVGRDEGAAFRVADGAVVPAAGARLVAGALEQANVSIAERMVQLTEVTRTFEALQRGISIVMNDLDGRAINELGRR